MAIKSVSNALRLVALALDGGDHKYGFEEWLKNGKHPFENLMDHTHGTERHLKRHLAGEWVDRDSRLPALAHVAARALMALEMELKIMPFKDCGVISERGVDGARARCDLPEEHPDDHYDAALNHWWK